MKNSLIIAIIASHLIVVLLRLPKWDNDKSIWVAAVEVDPLDPWNLNNAANAAHETDKRAAKWLASFLEIPIPDWLPFDEREPYRVGLEGLRDSLKASEHPQEAYLVNNKYNEVMAGHKIDVSYTPSYCVSSYSEQQKITKTTRPYLLDRYTESWGGLVGSSIVFNINMIFDTTVGKKQMFTPVVLAPMTTHLSHVLLEVCIPLSFKTEPLKTWILQDSNKECSRYSTGIPNIQKGAGINTEEAIFFTPQKTGEFLIRYRILSNELNPFGSFFTIKVNEVK